MKNKYFREVFFYAVGIVFLIGFFYISTYLMTKVVPTENKDLIGGVLETLKNGAILILGYFYGSSKSSSDKNALMADAGKPTGVKVIDAKTEQIIAENKPTP